LVAIVVAALPFLSESPTNSQGSSHVFPRIARFVAVCPCLFHSSFLLWRRVPGELRSLLLRHM
jgi:hypothetical protein